MPQWALIGTVPDPKQWVRASTGQPILKAKTTWQDRINGVPGILRPCDRSRDPLSSSSARIAAATGSCGIRPAYVVVSLSTVPLENGHRPQAVMMVPGILE